MKPNKTFGMLALLTLPVTAFATNGMNLEGYGPVATAMGGASFAFQNGAGAMMNNPATLGLMPEGRGIGVALGFLGPAATAASTKSGGDAYFMPAFGYVAKTGKLTYGLGVYSQGGMGTEYSANSLMAQNTGEGVRSEVGVGRLILPLVYNVNDQLTVGGSLDWVWATMDLKMAATTDQFAAMFSGTSAGPLGPMMTVMGGLMGSGTNRFRIDFSDNNDFSGQAFGSGFAGKLGIVYKFNDAMTMGATYHSRTRLGDMKTENGGAGFSAYTNTGALIPGTTMTGKVTVHNFQWPETYGFGLAYQMNSQWMLAADYKRLNWADVMRDFKMTFAPDGIADSGGFSINQNWKNQNVFMIGAAYRMNDHLTLRFGGNFAGNPVPDDRVNPLFPATIKDHYTFGFGYVLNRQSGIDFSMTYAPKVTVTGSQSLSGSMGSGAPSNRISISHGQLNAQFQYGYYF
jgi:long-chain fatty acid transport protein